MAKRQYSGPAISESVTMGARKFLSTINNSAQSQIAFFEDAVKRLGEKYGQEWSLVALNNNKLVMEDKANNYLMAEHSREKGGKVKITNIKKVELQEDKKPQQFEEACYNLVEAIESGDHRHVDSAFGRIAASRFRPTTVSPSGVVKTRDGVTRHLPLAESEEKSLAERIIEQISDKITINEDGSIEGVFIEDNKPIDLGVSELTTRRLVAKYMHDTAMSAYQSDNFQSLVESTAGLICKDNLEKAVQYAGKFLKEHQEFCLLNDDEWEELVGNALATRGYFNEDLASDTATLMKKTNLKVNRDEIIEAWKKTAEKAQHPVMLENVDNLAKAEDFERAYSNFLPTIIEATGETTRGALVAGLQMLRDRIGRGEIDEMTSNEIDQLINDVQTKGDSESIWRAMQTLDEVRRHVESTRGLDDFDEMPGPLDSPDVGDEPVAAPGEPQPDTADSKDKPFEINIKMDPMAMAREKQEEAAAESETDEKFDLDSLEDIDLEDEEPAPDRGEGREVDERDLEDVLAAGLEKDDKSVIGEFAKKEFGGDADVKVIGEYGHDWNVPGKVKQGENWRLEYTDNADRVAYVAEDTKVGNPDVARMYIESEGGICLISDTEGNVLGFATPNVGARDVEGAPMVVDNELSSLLEQCGIDPDGADASEADEAEATDDYALPAGLEQEDIEIDREYSTVTEEFSDQDVADFDKEIESDDDPDALQAAAEAYVREKKKDRVDGIGDPKQQQEEVTRLAGELVAARQDHVKSESTDEEDSDESIEEDQYKSPLAQYARRGFKRAAIHKLARRNGLKWNRRDGSAVEGQYKDIKFIIDNTENPAAILSEDGDIQVPIPDEMVKGALYVSEVSDEEAEADAFVEWLDSMIESLRRSEDEVTEGGLPSHLEKYKFGKKDKKDKGEEQEESEDGDEEDEGKDNPGHEEEC